MAAFPIVALETGQGAYPTCAREGGQDVGVVWGLLRLPWKLGRAQLRTTEPTRFAECFAYLGVP